jgi:hypothetical protein
MWVLVQDLDSVLIKILPHFDLYPLQKIKQKDYLDLKGSVYCPRRSLVYTLLKRVLPNLRLLKREWTASPVDLTRPVLRPIFDTTSSDLIWSSSNLEYDKVDLGP